MTELSEVPPAGDISRRPWWKKKRWWAAGALWFAAAYLLAYGPVRYHLPARYPDQPWIESLAAAAFRPIDRLATGGPRSVREGLRWYRGQWAWLAPPVEEEVEDW